MIALLVILILVPLVAAAIVVWTAAVLLWALASVSVGIVQVLAHAILERD